MKIQIGQNYCCIQYKIEGLNCLNFFIVYIKRKVREDVYAPTEHVDSYYDSFQYVHSKTLYPVCEFYKLQNQMQKFKEKNKETYEWSLNDEVFYLRYRDKYYDEKHIYMKGEKSKITQINTSIQLKGNFTNYLLKDEGLHEFQKEHLYPVHFYDEFVKIINPYNVFNR